MSMSFRLRLFLTAAVIVAGVLAIAMGTGWSRVVKFEIGRLDERLCSEARRLAMERFSSGELPRLESDMAQKLRLGSPDQLLLQFEAGEPGLGYRSALWDATVGTEQLNWSHLPEPARPPPPSAGRAGVAAPDCAFADINSRGEHWRVARSDSAGASGSVAANLMAPLAEIRGALLSALTVEFPVSIALTALGAWLLAVFTMKPVNRLREAMKKVTPSALDQRLDKAGEDREFAELIAAYNTMLERLERSFHQASRFSADAAHELKTPLTILRGRLEQARRKTDSVELRAELSDLLDEVARLASITRKLLLLSQADAGKLELNRSSVDLSQLLEQAMEDARMTAEGKSLDSSITPGLVVKGDQILLQQLFNNLLGNALRYGQSDGFIRLKARRQEDLVEVVLCNNCPPVAQAERERFFERFYRGDASRTRSVQGSGLGLSLALEIARAHHGELTLEPSPDTEIRLRLALPFE